MLQLVRGTAWGLGPQRQPGAGPLTRHCFRALRREAGPAEEVHGMYYGKRFNEVLALALPEAVKSHDLLCVRWRPGRASGALGRPGNRRADVWIPAEGRGPGAPGAGGDLPPTQTAGRRALEGETVLTEFKKMSRIWAKKRRKNFRQWKWHEDKQGAGGIMETAVLVTSVPLAAKCF